MRHKVVHDYLGVDEDIVRQVAVLRAPSSSIAHAFHRVRVARAMNGDPRCGHFDVAQIVGCQFDVGGSDVLVETMPFRRTWDGDNPGLLREKPGERNLTR
jgi:hypothetical protein